MGLFHRHRWEILSRTYSPPVTGTRTAQGLEAIRLLHLREVGSTSFLLKCRCGEIKTMQLEGQEERGVHEIKFKAVKG